MIQEHSGFLAVPTRARGFSLVEVLVSLIIISIGLLGIAKIQALAYANTGTASQRSLAAIEAASLASAMRANRAYWAVSGTPPSPLTVAGAVISDVTLNGAATTATFCMWPTSCAPAVLAAYDLHRWATDLNTLLPNPSALITCPVPAAGDPVNCTIRVSWTEKQSVALSNQVAGGPAMLTAAYTLYVEP